MTANAQIQWRHPEGNPHLDAPCSEMDAPVVEKLSPLHSQETFRVIEKCLTRKSMLRLVGDHRGERITSLNGVIWITLSGNPEDILLCAGETFTITQKGSILIGGLGETHLTITRHSAKSPGFTQAYVS